ncbi:xanthine dehydrogenase molybdenum binding subunit apoprotein [Lentzea atacamensis]|uniref:Xanthine dehydrogenase molybdenum binding subunit apoprotein n=2 Tax=Lentzea TaxID=165301 RepID=A0A316I262_9PSEU|nr:molybdopterin cofactor-binding domain-containing protein [Lentzea atacamensis]PWK86410.1 xanthine dehydrogenase molybdenum binding subunit apoprotein [Lentzea atacamensis]RAS59790.1 xanthine dehydrogenase molybdenum binding subunit apoprotein [Lentzea atacamensis]
MTLTPAELTSAVSGGIGTSPQRPDGNLKVRGEFAYASDLWHEDMIWGATLRSPHPYARIVSVDLTEALKVPGVYAVLTHSDVPGRNLYGLEHKDQPVLAVDVVRYQGEPIALVGADHPETALRAMKKIAVVYDVLEPVVDMETAVDDTPLHPGGNLVRHVPIRRGAQDLTADVVVTGRYEVGMQDQAFLGPESGLAVPAEDGSIDLYIATQWLHVDRDQVASALGLPLDKVRLTLSGVGGAFGGREDLSMQVHACLLALHTGKPVKMVYNREESFYGHVHRHPAVLYYEHGADHTGKLVYVRAKIYLDGGAYASSTPAVVANAATLGVGPYEVDNVTVDCYGVYTNNPPCGAMRGFGAVQAGFAYESQMDKLAEALGMSPVDVRVRNAMTEGSVMPTGQVVDSAAPVAQLLKLVQDKPLPAGTSSDIRELPGGVSNTTHGEGVVRGVGYAVGIKNICFSEGYDDYSTARVRVSMVNGELAAAVHTAACEVGQGLVTIMQQIVRTELGIERVTVLPMDTTIGNGGSTSASRQTYVTGGAVKAACAAVRSRLDGRTDIGSEVIDETVEWRHRATEALDPVTGQGNAHVQYGFAAHRAVVDVDVDLGLVKVVALDCAQDVGRALNPQAVVGQIQGGSAQGLGLAVMEEIQTSGGKVRNPSFTDYLIPTVLDMPPMSIDVLELADPHAPYGIRGVGEPPTISSTPAIVAAIRAATGLALTRVPVRPEHLTGT